MSPLSQSRLHIQQVIRFGFSVIVVGLMLGYVYYQARNLIHGPVIQITDELSSIQNERSVVIEGNASNIVLLTLNGKQIFTDEQGDFKRVLVLENGYSIMTLRAEDRFGRSEVVTREFVYVPASL